MMRGAIIVFLSGLLLVTGPLHAQQVPEEYRAYREKYPEGPPLNRWDSVFLMNIPEKKMDKRLRGRNLPAMVDNSGLPYMRPVFNQEGASCGQAAMIGYNFTYEIDYLRGLRADTLPNQYPTHFSYNFMNGGFGWFGVSYFHSLEILRRLGCMNALDYGGITDNNARWINGYEVYFNAMHNRIRGFHSIRTGSEEGILALKNWLFDHMGEGDAGGVASFYANTPWNAKLLNDTTPEGGKHVVVTWYPIASHAMTIVGYNDSIRWDYNLDGRYTNDTDLNGDGVIDPRDWEIGAVKFVNSHGYGAQDSGYCYLMYKCLAENFEDGGLWNQSVHILDVDTGYAPLLSFKVKLRHDYREKIRVLAGVSADTTDRLPSFTMDFPVFNHQGADFFLQGDNSAEEFQYLEFGLDVTPLLAQIKPGEPARFFLIVEEKDPFNEGRGEIVAFSLMDHTNGLSEINSHEAPVSLHNDRPTQVSVTHTVGFDRPVITTESLPPFVPQAPYGMQLEASGGKPPYQWDFKHEYRTETRAGEFPAITEHQLIPNAGGDTLVAVPLGFSFPFFGEYHDTAYLHIDGYLQFDRKQLPWPYLIDLDLHLRSNRVIAPMTHPRFTVSLPDGDGAWYTATDSAVTFRWKLSWGLKPAMTDLNFAARLHADGRICFIYGESETGREKWVAGISAGNLSDYSYSLFSGRPYVVPGTTQTFFCTSFPEGLKIDEEGWLTALPLKEDEIFDIHARVTDRMGISTVKTFGLSTGPVIHAEFRTQHDTGIFYGDTAWINLEVINNGQVPLHDASIRANGDDPFIQWINREISGISLMPGESISLEAVFAFVVSLQTPDQHILPMAFSLEAGGSQWTRSAWQPVRSPGLALQEAWIEDGQNGKLDPGETAILKIRLLNTGHAPIYGVSSRLDVMEPYATVLDNPVQVFGMIAKGGQVTAGYQVRAESYIPEGMPFRCLFATSSLPGLTTNDTVSLMIGRLPVMVIDMDPNSHSGPMMSALLDSIGIMNKYETFLPNNLHEYQSLFIALGYHNSNHVLSWNEGLELAGYLEQGGNIYLEGKKTWKDDPVTPVQPMFRIAHAGVPVMFDTLAGYDSAFTAGIRLLNDSPYPFSFYHMEPLDPAFAILKGNVNGLPCAVAHDAGTYKTIGTLFELGTLADLPGSTPIMLLEKYLEFFGIQKQSTGVDVLPQTSVELLFLYPNPAADWLTVGNKQSVVSSRQRAVEIAVVDITGRTVMSFPDRLLPCRIDIAGLKEGLYFVRITGSQGVAGTGKFVKTGP